MAGGTLIRDEAGAVTADWVALTAGILILGLIVVMQVVGNSSGYLMDEFESLNREYENNAVTLTKLKRDQAEPTTLPASDGAMTSR